MGTPLFSSPEILTKNEFSEKSDAWAVGVILYHLCCLRLPFSEKSYRRIIEAIKTKSPGPIPPQYSTDLQTIISRLLDKNPETRASVHDILNMSFVKNLGDIDNPSSFKTQKEKSCDFKISQKSLKNDFENLRIYKNSNFMSKDVLEKLEKERNWDSESDSNSNSNSNMLEMNESMVIENKNDSTMGNQLRNEDINWLRERMSVAGSLKTSIRKLHTNFDVKGAPTESDK
jgi:NIMA (never in mitosis gene a)-related kinase